MGIWLCASPAAAGDHAYFEGLIALPSAVRWASLRQDGVDWNLSNGADTIGLASETPPTNTWITYDAGMDAAKVTWQEAETQVNNQLRCELGPITSGDVLIIYDAYIPSLWATAANGGQVNQVVLDYTHKWTQVAMSAASNENGGEGNIFLETRQVYKYDQTEPSHTSNRGYWESPSILSDTNEPVNKRGPTGVIDATTTRRVPGAQWFREVQRIRLNLAHTDAAFDAWEAEFGTLPTGTYHCWDRWLITAGATYRRLAGRPVPRLRDSAAWEADRICAWWIEANTSSYHVTPTDGKVTFTGTPGTNIPNNTTITRTSNSFDYRTQASVNIGGGGSVEVAVEAATFAPAMGGGEAGNFSVGEDFTLNTPISGVDNAVEGTVAATNGRWIVDDPAYQYFRNLIVLNGYGDPDGTILSTQGLG